MKKNLAITCNIVQRVAMKKQKMQRSSGSREVLGWKVEPKAWYPEIGLNGAAAQREAKKREREDQKEKTEGSTRL